MPERTRRRSPIFCCILFWRTCPDGCDLSALGFRGVGSLHLLCLAHSRPLQAIIDWGITQQGWHCHCREAG